MYDTQTHNLGVVHFPPNSNLVKGGLTHLMEDFDHLQVDQEHDNILTEIYGGDYIFCLLCSGLNKNLITGCKLITA